VTHITERCNRAWFFEKSAENGRIGGQKISSFLRKSRIKGLLHHVNPGKYFPCTLIL